ncbi:MAG: Gfo/Idh/MocA family oxidoreductase [Bacteroidales bacterium]|nr:Gfo/Idh/MocA family oxidoreductase [Bacteroidales bacterium]
MKKEKGSMSRRSFITTTGAAIAGTMLSVPANGMLLKNPFEGKRRIALVGTGVRGISFWGKSILENYGDIVEFVALCDINPGRLAYAKKYIGVDCPTFTDFDEMLKKVPVDLLMVTTVDSTHDEFIIKALKKGIHVATEKPMTTDEVKCQKILDADRASDKNIFMGFNYRYGIYPTRIKEFLVQKKVGEITSVDFHWYLNVYHGASYFRRWHGLRSEGGTLLLHKASHHFDLLNWWLNSEPVEVHAYGDLEHYGKNNSFRGPNCRICEHKEKCKFYWDMTKDEHLMSLYAKNEEYDGYIRDNCLWREEIDIFDKMAVQIKYANNVQVSYSLTTYSPFEGFRIAFNGMEGRLESWEGLPWREKEQQDQAAIYEKEMDQSHVEKENEFHEIIIQKNFEEYELVKLPYIRKGHWGGDRRMHDLLFKGTKLEEGLNHEANSRDGAMAVLIGIAARKSIDEKRIVKIEELTDLKPRAKRWE